MCRGYGAVIPTLVNLAEDDYTGKPSLRISRDGGVKHVNSCEVVSISIADEYIQVGWLEMGRKV